MSITSINPVNGEIIKSYPEDNESIINDKIEKAQIAFNTWRNLPIQQRAELLTKAAVMLRKRKKELAELMASEMGKPLKDGQGEIEKCASVCDYYAEEGPLFLRDQKIGVVLAVMPWNFPFWQVFRFLAPGLLAGNCGVLKHASNVPGCALSIESILLEAGFPEHVFQTLLIGSKATAQVIAHQHVKAVTLTGSTDAGIQVAKQAASLLKKTVLELGGSDAYLILADADLESAAEFCTQSRLINNGQSCIAAKRFIVDKTVEKQFTSLFKAKMEARKTGNPFLDDTQLGPMARKDLRDELHKQVLDNILAGATCILGGGIPLYEGDHAFYSPTILTGIKKGMPAYEEEIFGPVASIITAEDTEDAIDIANDSVFGLGAAVFTANIELGNEIAKSRLNAGSCFVNSMVKSDPRLPFGGINQSGYGRELSIFGIHEFVNIKTIYIR
jgi:succinate-semialdehyde dehydrogenase/glutarate-semialdehyde dehydrogenase